MAEITLWKPEPDIILRQALGKMAEELGELQQVVARCLIQGYVESDPKTGEHNYVALRQEMADVLATMDWLVTLRPELDTFKSSRRARKLAGYLKWQVMLEEHIAASTPHPLGWRIVNEAGRTVFWDYSLKAVHDAREKNHPDRQIEPMWSHEQKAIGP